MDHDRPGADLNPPALSDAISPEGGTCRLRVRLTPGSSADALEGVETAADGKAHLKVRVRAVPEKGKANKALIKLLAKSTGLPASAFDIASGHTARIKSVSVEAAAGELCHHLESALARR